MMRARATALLSLLLAILAAGPAAATKYAGEFLKIPVGARALGMGGAFTAVADDATAPWWNPAGMVYLPYREFLPQHAEKFGSLVNQDYVGAVFPLGGQPARHSALGIAVLRSAVDDIPITPRPEDLKPIIDFDDYGLDNNSTTNDFGQGDGIWQPGERLHIPASEIFLASSSDMALFTSFARQHGTHWAYGGTVKFVRQSIPAAPPDKHATSFGAGVDVGVLYMPTDAVTLAGVVRDLTTTYLAWSNGSREVVTPTIDTGSAFNFYPANHHALTLALDLAWGFEGRKLDSELKLGNTTAEVRTGVEYWYNNIFALRSGVNAKDLTFGAGVRYKQIGVDYAANLHRFFASGDKAFPDDQNLDTTHLVSASYSW
jgi:hypothetical protein